MSIYIVIYMLGIIPTYFIGRKFNLIWHSWTKKERLFIIFVSFFLNWIGFLMFFYMWVRDGTKLFNLLDEDATW